MTPTSSIFERLHRPDGPPPPLVRDSLPTPVRSWLRAACITDDHLAGLVVWLFAGGCFVTVAAGLYSVYGAIGAAVTLLLVPLLVLVSRRGERDRRIVEALPYVVDSLARSLRSGATFSQALSEGAAEAPAELAEELRVVIESTNRGQSVADALGGWVERSPTSQIRIVSATLALASENESGALYALGGVAQSLRDRAALADEVRALASQATASLRALVLLPIGFLVIDVATRQGSTSFLFTTELGRICFAAGVALNLLGGIWMRKLVNRQVMT